MKIFMFATVSLLSVLSFASVNSVIPKECLKIKKIEACSDTLTSLYLAGLEGNTTAISVFGKTAEAILKNRAFSKPQTVKVDTLLWIPCSKKERAECIEKCSLRTDSSFARLDSPDSASCILNPSKLVAKKIAVKKPSQMTLFIDSLAIAGFSNSSFDASPAWFSVLASINAIIPVSDSLFPTIMLAEKTLIGMDVNDFALVKNKFRYCAIFGDSINTILDSLDAAIRCPVIGSIVDSRDSKSYRVERFGERIWMIDNLNFDDTNGSSCYDGDSLNCEKYGRLYTFDVAKTACPEGFRLATNSDFEDLVTSFGADFSVSTKFGGYFNQNGICTILGEGAYFWSADEEDESRAFARSFFSGETEFSKISVDKKFGLSVRCVQKL